MSLLWFIDIVCLCCINKCQLSCENVKAVRDTFYVWLVLSPPAPCEIMRAWRSSWCHQHIDTFVPASHVTREQTLLVTGTGQTGHRAQGIGKDRGATAATTACTISRHITEELIKTCQKCIIKFLSPSHINLQNPITKTVAASRANQFDTIVHKIF